MNKEKIDILVSILNLEVESLGYNVDEDGFGYSTIDYEIDTIADDNVQDALEWLFDELKEREEINKTNEILIPRILNEYKNFKKSDTPIYDMYKQYKDYEYISYRNAIDKINSMYLNCIPIISIMMLDDVWVENNISLLNFEDL